MKIKHILGKDLYYHDSSDNVVTALKSGVLFGESGFRLLSGFIKEHGVLLDVGAHIGTFSLPARHAGFRTIMFEAASLNCEALRATFGEDVHEGIVSDVVKKVGFSRDTGPQGWVTDGDEFTTMTIDSVVGDTKIVGIKIDIEGSEIEALSGAESVISRDKPPMVIEVNGFCLMQSGRTCEDLIRKIADLNYLVILPINGHLVLIDPDKKYPFCNSDVVCIHMDDIGSYRLENVFSFSDTDLLSIAKKSYDNSNEDCKNYFNKIYPPR